MTTFFTISKSDINKAMIDRLLLAISAEYDDYCFCMDSSGDTYEIGITEQIGEWLFFELRGFCNGFVGYISFRGVKI